MQNEHEREIEYVKSHLSYRDKLEAVAEEAAELSQAALKLIRTSRAGGNWTPTPHGKAVENFDEELLDLCSCLLLFGRMPVTGEEIRSYWKWQRWAQRLGYTEEDDPDGKEGRVDPIRDS